MSNADEVIRRNRSRSWWKQRTRMEKTCAVLLVIAAVLIIGLIIGIAVASSKAKSKAEHDSVCLTPGCVKAATDVLQRIDDSINPCDNFYQFACGRYAKETYLPDDKTSLTSFVILQDLVKQQLKALLEEPIELNEPKPFALVKKFYNICMNTSAVEADGLNTVKRIFKQVGGWPVLEGSNWDENSFDWKTSTYKFRHRGLTYRHFITFDTTYDAKNSSLRIIYLDQPQLDIEKDNLLGGLEDSVVKGYYDYMIDLAELFGANRATAEDDVRNMINFKTELAKITLSATERGDVNTIYNPMTITELESNYSSIPWLELINNIVDRPNVQVTPTEVINVKGLDYLSRLETLLQRTHKRDQANYAFFLAVRQIVSYLPQNIINRERQYLSTLYALPEKSARWSDCIDQIIARFKEASGALYARKHFHEDSKKVVSEMVSDIRKELVKLIEKVDWMDEGTRKKAIDKALAISTHIGYPDEFLDDKKLEEHYAEVNFTSDKYLDVGLQMELLETNSDFGQLHDPINKTDWRMRQSIVVINAAYLAQENSIQLPAGTLQDPLYSKGRPRYMNYAAIGYIIGHEVTHGFDSLGRLFDKVGDLVSWWAPETDNAFKEKSKCMIKQYGDIVAPEIKTNLNGEKTLGENIADNGGIKEAYLAYNRWVERHGPEPELPGLNYTAKQLFWISAAHTWCVKQTNKFLEDTIAIDPHSPSPYRVLVPFSNTEYFAKDFNCPVGSRMNPKHKCKVW